MVDKVIITLNFIKKILIVDYMDVNSSDIDSPGYPLE